MSNNKDLKIAHALDLDAKSRDGLITKVVDNDVLIEPKPYVVPKLTKEQKAEWKEKLIIQRKEYRQKINELKIQLNKMIKEKNHLYDTLPAKYQIELQDNLRIEIEKLKNDPDNIETKNKIKEIEDNLSNLKTYIKKIPFVLELRNQIKSIRKDISQYRILLKDKSPNIEVFSKSFNPENIFEVKNFCLWYKNGTKNALADINIEITKNKVTALIGPSGCGKSTFLRSLNRMNDLIDGVKTTGDIWFLGKNIASKILTDLELRTRVGMVFQKPTPFNFSIYENIAYALRSHGIKSKEAIDKIVVESLKDAALWDEVKDILHESALGLSGGQQQRLCIARAIALQPDVLLMDEPTSALDPIATSKIEQLIFKLKEKFTIVIVTHSMAQAQRISDNTIFFYQGRIIEFGKTKQIFTRPRETRTKDYVSGRIG